MKKAPFYAKGMSLGARKFLYACAFWIVAADEQLKPEEQKWLVDQFGADGATRSLDEFVALESEAFFEVFDGSAEELNDEEKLAIYPHLEGWLVSCVESGSDMTGNEREIIAKIKRRLNLAAEVERLSGWKNGIDSPFAGQVATVEEKLLTGHTGEIASVDVNGDGTFALSAADDGVIKLWDIDGGSEKRSFAGHKAGVLDVCFCPDGKHFVSGDRMGQIRLWNVESGKSLWVSDQTRQGGITGLDVSADGKLVTFSSDVGTFGVMGVERGDNEKVFSHKKRGAFLDIAFSPDGRYLLTGGDDKNLSLWETKSGVEVRTFEGHEDGVTSVCFSPDGKKALSGSRDNTIRFWSVDAGELVTTLRGHTFSVYCVGFSPDGRHALSGSWDHTVRIWNLETGQAEFKMESPDSRFSGVVFLPDGKRVVAGGSDKSVHVVVLPG